MNRVDFIKSKFREHYASKGVVPPLDFHLREFGFGNDKKIDYRHFAFKTPEELRNYFVTNTPLYASFSAAYYEFPDARPMEKKKAIGSDLVFEFDIECSHGRLACEECINAAKAETVKLIEDFLIPDFGFAKSEISVVFSGSRGFHVYVRNGAVKQLNSAARRQIVDYLQGNGLDYGLVLQDASLKSKGWKGRLARAVYEAIRDTEPKDFKKIGLVGLKEWATEERKLELLKNITQGNYRMIRKLDVFAEKMLATRAVRLSAGIDQSVTLDVSRLIRMPSTLHGGAGLLCMPAEPLDRFNPFRDAVVFGSAPANMKILKDIGAFTLKEQSFGPFKAGETRELPEFAAVFLACKTAAEPA